MIDKLKDLKNWLKNIDYGDLAAPTDRNIIYGVVDLSRHPDKLLISIIPEQIEDPEKYDFVTGKGKQLTVTITILCRGAKQSDLLEQISGYENVISDAIYQDCSLGDIAEGSALGTRKFYLDAGAVENQMTACEIELTLLYIHNYE